MAKKDAEQDMEEFEMDRAIHILMESEDIKSDEQMMKKLQMQLKKKKRKLNNVETSLSQQFKNTFKKLGFND